MYLSFSFQERVMHTVTKYNTKYVLSTLVKQNAGNSVSVPDIVVVLIPTNKHSLFFFSEFRHCWLFIAVMKYSSWFTGSEALIKICNEPIHSKIWHMSQFLPEGSSPKSHFLTEANNGNKWEGLGCFKCEVTALAWRSRGLLPKKSLIFNTRKQML